MNKNDRWQLLRSKNITAQMIAIPLNVTPQSVGQTMNDGKTSRRIAQAIADVCEVELEEMFPYYRNKTSQKTRDEIQQKINQILKEA
ncbi:DNA-binding protein [Ignatzschineria cameli]|uniref:DNA-binding protein n=1 Tax=Ignatzschineria cameli TaxID=2182793 RepID=UPI000D61ED96|nr:DNA-binding protein [Ignatzschineria cameli]PWD89577.1 DNA-binding protein [Ignatzschineria cameli]